jgi:hypothetical protein
MGLMDRMMDRMIINMSVAEKEDMMMRMMPIMMAGIDINTMMPIMLKEVGSIITLTGIYTLLWEALNDEELKQEFSEIVASLKEKVPELVAAMQDMMPTMMSLMTETGILDGMMNVMENMMPVMMPMMREMMPTMMNKRMPKVMAQHKNVNELMPAMMIDIMPECLEMIAPEIEQEKRTAFLSRLAEKMERAGSVDAQLGE